MKCLLPECEKISPLHMKVLESAFTGKVKKAECNCVVWTGKVTSGYSFAGYGQMYDPAVKKIMLVHKVAYQIISKKKVKKGFVVDHICMLKVCINPSHLEPVTSSENCRRYQAYLRTIADKIGIKKVCSLCGQKYNALKSWSKYCSPRCGDVVRHRKFRNKPAAQ